MNTSQKLEIILIDEKVDLPCLLIEACSSPWEFDNKENDNSSISNRRYLFKSTGDRDSKPACLVFARKSDDTFYVPNLWSTEPGTFFTAEESNAVLQSFIMKVIEQVPNDGKFTSVLSSDKLDLSILLGDKAMELLNQFSSLANKISLHPNDRERFYDFIVHIHREKIDLDEDIFERWLVEEDRWPDDEASKIRDKFTFCKALLSRYEELCEYDTK